VGVETPKLVLVRIIEFYSSEKRPLDNWFYLTRLILSPCTDLSALGQSLTLSYLIYISLATINSLIVRLIGYIACFFLLVHLRLDIPLTQ
jgi:hypothetical protein